MTLNAQPDSQRDITHQPMVLLVAPILPGKAEAWRRFMQELLGSRRREYEASRRRLGVRSERAWISETRRGASGIAFIQADYPERAFTTLITSNHPFDRWFREQLLALHGIDLTPPASTFVPTLVLAWEMAGGDHDRPATKGGAGAHSLKP